MASVLADFTLKEVKDLIVGFENPEDAAVYEIAPGVDIVQTVDFFTPIVDDPYLFGRISAANSLSDIYAMGGVPKTAMNIVCFPSCLDLSILEQILRGGRDVAESAGVAIIGGHTIEDDEPKYGMSVTGIVKRGDIKTIDGARVSDKIILTKPLGLGILATALKAELVSEDEISEAIETAALLNRAPAQIMLKYDVSSCTDVTGFGLLGHLHGVMKASKASCIIESAKVPVYPKALEFAGMGIVPEGAYKNRDYLGSQGLISDDIQTALQDVLFDPQTSGGLLIFVSAKDADSLVDELKLNPDVAVAEIIGEVIKPQEFEITVV